ncbi:MAG: NAD(P)/FAD-dependent oxidoreductase [Deltaproteobacteria bacterium]|nr:NAD(P)/FAD-dependent oxidoreductase [Deltaproteobacteria bacterium]
MKRIAILGAGTGGTMMANKLVRALPEQAWQVTVIDRDAQHLYQPGLLLLPFGTYAEADLLKPRPDTLDPRVDLRLAEIDQLAPAEKRVVLRGGESIAYDVLIVATGSRVIPEQTAGLTGFGWRKTAFDFYTLEGSKALAAALDGFRGGRVVVNVAEMPIKCPVAPLEFTFLAEAFFAARGLREKVKLVYATPLEGAFTKPKASALLGSMLEQRGIEVMGDFSVASVDGEKRTLKSYDGRETGYDLLVTVPVHGGDDVIRRSGLGDASGWVPTDKHTLQSKAFPEVFTIGDATDLPASKAGAVAHFQSATLLENVLRFIAGKPLAASFDGHTNCFIETGRGKAMLIDFNYETEPLPGRFPLPGVGPFTLLEESATNHWGKLAFKWLYWNALLPGKELPIDDRMLMAGKWAA